MYYVLLSYILALQSLYTMYIGARVHRYILNTTYFHISNIQYFNILNPTYQGHTGHYSRPSIANWDGMGDIYNVAC